jgi:hypothetical protein
VRKLACIFLVLLSGAFVYTQRSSSTRFAFGSGTSTELPFSIAQNLILVKASVNGSTQEHSFLTPARKAPSSMQHSHEGPLDAKRQNDGNRFGRQRNSWDHQECQRSSRKP